MKSQHKKNRPAGGMQAVLDVGSVKVACFIAEIDADRNVQIRGVGHQLSRGIRAGVITDFQDAETSIIAAVHAAEQMAGITVDSALLCLSGGGLSSRNVMIDMAMLGEEVSDRDLLDIVEQGRASVENDMAEVIHCLPVAYTLDGAAGVADPRRMRGENLSAELHLVTAHASVTRNLMHCVARCHLNVEEFVAAPYAAALACVEEDEMQLGVTVIDMGGSATGIAVFSAGKLVFCDAVPVGGLHVTSDIAKGLSTTLAHAERLKTLHGSCIGTTSDMQVMISVPQLGESGEGEDDGTVLPRAQLVGIIRPRVEEIFEMIRGRLEAGGVDPSASRRVVLTGGASQLIGIRDVATRVLSRHVRLGKPKAQPGLAEAVSGPAFSSALGLLHYTLNKPLEERLLDSARRPSGMGKTMKVLTGWFKENF